MHQGSETMAAHACPQCHEQGFTWHIDEERPHLTLWVCSLCGYVASEDESREALCQHCGIRALSELQDSSGIYRYCFSCNRRTSRLVADG